MAEALAADLDGHVVYDPDPDNRLRSPWRTYRHALEQPRDPLTTHLLVIQDDAWACPYLKDVLDTIAAARDGFITLYVGGMPLQAAIMLEQACKECWSFASLPTYQWTPAVALIWPTDVIPAALDWIDVEARSWPREYTADDDIIGRITRQFNLPLWATVPSLVDHPDDVPSIVGNKPAMGGRNPWRCARLLIDDDCDVRDYDW